MWRLAYYSCEVLWLMLCEGSVEGWARASSRWPRGSSCTLVITADANELGLEVMEDFVEGNDGVLLGGMGRTQVDGFSGSLHGMISNANREFVSRRPTMVT